MCLHVDKNCKTETAKLKFDADKKRVCFKIVKYFEYAQKYSSVFRGNDINLGEELVSDRDCVELKEWEDPTVLDNYGHAEVNRGIHVYLDLAEAFHDVVKSYEYYGAAFAPNVVVIECVCHQDDLVVVGTNVCWGYNTKGAVFMKVLPTRVIKKEEAEID